MNAYGNNFLKGLLLGGAGYTGILGLSELQKYVAKKMKQQYQVFPEDILFDNPDDEKVKKQASWGIDFGQPNSLPFTESFYNKVFLGAGIPFGVYFANKGFEALKEKADAFHTKSKLKELQEAYDEHQFAINKSKQKQKEVQANYKKMQKSAKIQAWLDGYIGAMEKSADFPSFKSLGDIGSFIGNEAIPFGTGLLDLAKTYYMDIPTQVLPYVYGGLAGTGALAGYHGAKYMSGDHLEEDPLSKETPKLVYEYNKTKKINKKAEVDPKVFADYKKRLRKQTNTPEYFKFKKDYYAREKNIDLAGGPQSNGFFSGYNKVLKGLFGYNFDDAEKDLIDAPLNYLGQKGKKLVQPALDYTKKEIPKIIDNTIKNPKTWLGAAGLGAAFALPSLLGSAFSGGGHAPQPVQTQRQQILNNPYSSYKGYR